MFITEKKLPWIISQVGPRKRLAYNNKGLFPGWFILDLLAALPFDLLYATCMVRTVVRGQTFNFFLLCILLCLKLLQHFNVPHLLTLMKLCKVCAEKFNMFILSNRHTCIVELHYRICPNLKQILTLSWIFLNKSTYSCK